MIQANELRIGNFLNSERFGICQVITIYKNNFDVSTEGKHKKEWFLGLECNPIPITEEWLLKFGFEKDEEFDNHFVDFGSLKQEIIRYAIDSNYFTIELFAGQVFEIENTKYIHQLQNLYFALIQKELELK